MRKSLFIIITLILVQMSNAQTSYYYFGQTPPGDTAKIFAPGIVSLPNRNETIIAFHPDGKEFYICENRLRYSKYENNVWSTFTDLPFNTNQGYNEFSFSAIGKKMFITRFDASGDIWVSNRVGDSWGQPTVLPAPINSTGRDMGYTETADSVIYICSNRSGGMGSTDIYCIRRMPDNTLQAENLGAAVNTSSSESIPCVVRDGSYLVFSSERPGKYGLTDLYVTFKKANNEWTAPINLENGGFKINLPSYAQGYVSISPDGKYLFFNRHQLGGANQDIYWVSTHIFETLKKQAFAPKLSIQIPNTNINADTLFNYAIPNNTFSCEYGIDKLNYTATLSDGSALPGWLTFNAGTRTLSGTPKQAEVLNLKITATNADMVSVSTTFIITVTKLTGIEESNNNLPTEFKLCQNYPNPFNPSTIINYQLPVGGNVRLKIYDTLGKEISTLVNEYQQAGNYNYKFSIDNYTLSSGMYFYALTSAKGTITKKMMLAK